MPGNTQPPSSDNALTRIVRNNLRVIIALMVLIVCLAVAYSLIRYFEARGIEEDQARLLEVMKEPSAGERIKLLEQMLTAADEKVRPSVAFEYIMAGLETSNNTIVIKGWESLGSATSGLDIAPDMRIVAAIGKASALENQGDTAGALLLLKEARAGAPAYLKLFVLERLAVAASLAGEYATAVDVYTELKAVDIRNASEDERRISELNEKNAEASSAAQPASGSE
jgi:hypothetical protein